MIDKNINQYWMKHILGEKENKSSLKVMSKTLCQFGKPHSTWSFVRDNPTDVQKAAIKTRILTGCYTLQANRSKFNQHEVDPTCPICKSAPEDRKHVILQCSSIERIRGKYLSKIINFINESDKNIDLEKNIDTLLQLIIDPSAFYHEKRHLPILDQLRRRQEI
jgi:hypothetical protein